MENLGDADLAAFKAGVAAGRLATLQESFSTREVGRGLGINPSTVRRRGLQGHLLVFADRGTNRYPAWQFDEAPGGRLAPLPHLVELVSTISATDLHPASLHHLMNEPRCDLRVEDADLSARVWLLRNGAVSPVIDLIREADLPW